MWEAARDLALEHPKIPRDVLMRLMGRSGGRRRSERPFPQLDECFEELLAMMANVLVIEIFADGTFDWGYRCSANPEVSARPEAAAMVGYIRTDETPARRVPAHRPQRAARVHAAPVAAGTIAGRRVVDGLLHGILRDITRNRRAISATTCARTSPPRCGSQEPRRAARRVRRARNRVDAAAEHGLRARRSGRRHGARSREDVGAPLSLSTSTIRDP